MDQLQLELAAARERHLTDGYEMTLGEIQHLYEKKRLVIDPHFQQLFRWNDLQKSTFVESLLLGDRLAPLIMRQRPSYEMELVDGVQRVCTVLQLMRSLKAPDGRPADPLQLCGTRLLPSLAGMRWQGDEDNDEDDDPSAFTMALRLQVMRARMHVVILRKEGDPQIRFDLMQRLSATPSPVSAQEVRTCILHMINPAVGTWFDRMTDLHEFTETLQLSQQQRGAQEHIEWMLRVLALRWIPYESSRPFSLYLDDASRRLAVMPASQMDEARLQFSWIFRTLRHAVGADVFRRWDGLRHTGPICGHAVDVIAHGLGMNQQAIEEMETSQRAAWLSDAIHHLWRNDTFLQLSTAEMCDQGRFNALLALGIRHFAP